MGFRNDAKNWSEKCHQLPFPPDAKGERNYALILQQINNFMGHESQLPPLFTTKNDIPIIESLIRQFCATTDEDPNRYRVYPIHQLFFEIKEEAVRNSINGTSFRSIFVAEAQLNRFPEFYRNIACNVSS